VPLEEDDVAKKSVGVTKVQEDEWGNVQNVTVGETSRAANKSAGGRHGDFQKDGLGSRIVDGLLNKFGR
jgi:hypothetical protein